MPALVPTLVFKKSALESLAQALDQLHAAQWPQSAPAVHEQNSPLTQVKVSLFTAVLTCDPCAGDAC